MSWAELMDRCRNVLDTHPNRAFIAELDRMTDRTGPLIGWPGLPSDLVRIGRGDAGAAGGTSARHDEAGAYETEEGGVTEASPTMDYGAGELSDAAGPSGSVCRAAACQLACGLQHECNGVNGKQSHLAAATRFAGMGGRVCKTCADCREAQKAYSHKPGGCLDQQSAKKLQTSRDAEHANARLVGIETYDERALQCMAEAFLHGIARLLRAGSPAFLYGYAWCVRSAAGIRVSDAEVDAEEKEESLNTFRTSPNPLVRVPGPLAGKGWRHVKPEDVFRPAQAHPAVIKRLLVTSILSDVKIAEKYLHVLLDADPPGFRGNLRQGGTGKMKGSYLFGVSVLVLPSGLTAMGLEVRADHRDAFLAASWPNGGRRAGIELPTQQPPGPFPPKDARGGFVLGGRVVLAARRL